jgi:hypothetical protein
MHDRGDQKRPSRSQHHAGDGTHDRSASHHDKGLACGGGATGYHEGNEQAEDCRQSSGDRDGDRAVTP